MEAVAYKKVESLKTFNGKPVVDGRFLLVMKNPVNGFIHRVLITGSRSSVYTAVLSFSRDQWVPPLAVQYRVLDTFAGNAVLLKGNLKGALSTD